MSWLAHAHGTAPAQADLDRLDWERSVAELGAPPADAGVAPGPRGEAPPYLENPIDTYATLADQDAQIQAEVSRAYVETQYGGAEEARAEAEAADDWRRIVNRHSVLSTLRAAAEYATGRPILQRDSRERLACGVDGELQEHAEDGRRRFVVYRCHRRDRCPECSVAYGEGRGEELASLLDAVRTMTPERKGYPSGFGLEVTLPEPVSAAIGAALDRGDDAEARRLVRKAVKIVRAIVWDAVKRRGIERGDVGAAVNVHTFHSRTPMRRGWHVHVHVTIPNATRSGEHLRRHGRLGAMPRAGVPKRLRGALPPARSRDGEREDPSRVNRLDLLRARLRELVIREYGAEVDLSVLANVDLYWHFFGGGRSGWQGFRKRAMYVNRSPWHDAAKRAAGHPERTYGDRGMAELAVFAERVEAVQRALKVRRYLGWLSPGQRQKWGLVKDPGDKSPWRRCADYYRRVIRADATGLWVRAYGPFGIETAEHIAGELVTWAPTAPPRRWQTAAQRAAKETAAELDRARAATGPAVAVTPGLFGMVRA